MEWNDTVRVRDETNYKYAAHKTGAQEYGAAAVRQREYLSGNDELRL